MGLPKPFLKHYEINNKSASVKMHLETKGLRSIHDLLDQHFSPKGLAEAVTRMSPVEAFAT